jgi:hypothetical protein
MNNIVEEVKQGLENVTPAFKDSDVVKSYQKAIEEFEALVQKGLAQKRGNQLMSPVDAHLYIQRAEDTNGLF